MGSAASLADNLGKWLSVAVLAAAFGLAILLTMAAVTRRVREFGTLKALGWRSRRIIGQVLGESIAIGIAGGWPRRLGYGGAALIDKLAPKLSASTGPAATASGVAGSSRSRSAADHAHGLRDADRAGHARRICSRGLAVPRAARGMFGGWRAARLRRRRPSEGGVKRCTGFPE